MNLNYDDLKFLRACGVDCFWMAGSMRFQHFIRENGTEAEKLRLHNLKVGCSFRQFMVHRRDDEIAKMVSQFESKGMSDLSLFDRKFLASCHISAEPRRWTDKSFLRACGIEPPYRTTDSTTRLLAEFNIPQTRENYLRVEFMGNPPADGVLDGELEAELPEEFQAWDDEEEN